jgi:hypothetical protein
MYIKKWKRRWLKKRIFDYLGKDKTVAHEPLQIGLKTDLL